MKFRTIGLGLFIFVLGLTACQAGAVVPVLDRTSALATTAEGAASSASVTSPAPAAAAVETANPASQATPTTPAALVSQAAPTQPAANPTSSAATGPAANPAQASPSQAGPASNTTVNAASATSAAQASANQSSSSSGAASPAAKTCHDVAAFYGDVTIPDGTAFRAGDKFTKTWRFRNNGDCTWTPAYSVVFYAGEIMNAPLSIPFPSTVAPGQQVDISINMQAPARGGEFTGNWEFADPAGTRFAAGATGKDRFWVDINVSFVDSQGAALPAGPSPSTGFVPGAAAAIPAGCPGKQDRSYETQVVALINQARQQNGLPPLQVNNQVAAAALSHSADLACNNFLNHTGSDGSSWYDRLRAQGYAYSDAHENIYAGDPGYGGDPQGAFNWWMNDQVHRDNILNPNVTEIGVGYVANSQSQYGGYFTVDFTRP
jgi:uncharacterized protein YkwD